METKILQSQPQQSAESKPVMEVPHEAELEQRDK